MKQLSLILILMALSACNMWQKKAPVKTIEKPLEKPVVVPQVAPPAQTTLLDYAATVIKLTPNQQKFEWNEVWAAAQKDKANVVLRMKLAILYALPSSRMQDPNKALAIINELQKSSGILPENEDLLTLLRDITLAAQKDAQKDTQKIKDEQKRADGLQQKNEQLLQQNSQLEQKLEALKRIEKTMVDRDQGVKQ